MNNKTISLKLSVAFLAALFSTQSFAAPPRPRAAATPSYTPTTAPVRSTTQTSVRSATRSQETTSYTPESLPRAAANEQISNERLFYIFAGIDLGMSMYSQYDGGTVNNPGAAKRSGFHGGGRLLGAFYFKKWVLDAGLGVHFISNSGTDPNFPANKVSVTTRGTYFEISPRYRFDEHWQLGPIFNYWFTTDNGLNPNALSEFPNNTSSWIGVEGLYEWMSDNWKYRLGGRWETALGVNGRSVNMFQILFQIGFPIFGGNDQPAEEPRQRVYEELNEQDVNRASLYADPMPTPEPTPWPSPSPEPTPEPTPKPVVLQHKPQAKFVVTLDVNRLPFETNSARLPRYHMDRLKEIGRFLAEHGSVWKRLVVSGHADERGSHPYNDNLTKARAQTVRQLLLEGGAPAKKITAIGYGKRRPIDKRHNEKAWAKNRRVQFEFYGVKDMVIINDGVNITPQAPQ